MFRMIRMKLLKFSSFAAILFYVIIYYASYKGVKLELNPKNPDDGDLLLESLNERIRLKRDMKMYFQQFSKEKIKEYLFAQFGDNESFFTADIEPADFTDLDVNASFTENEVRFFPPFPTVLRGEPGNDFENLTLKMDSVNRNFCNDSTFIIAVIPSSTTNFEDREIIRRSWGSSYLFHYSKLRTIFLVGATENEALQKELEQEARNHGDLLQMNFIDSYRNLTYKTMVALLWISENCKDVPWILKADDDVVVNPFSLRQFLEKELSRNKSPDIIYGRLRPHSEPFRSGKWGITKEEYKEKYYPPFILGSAYVIAKNSIDKLIKSAYETPFFPLEDVFTTGIVRKKAGVSFKNIEHTHFGTTATKSFYKGKVIFLVGLTPKKRRLIWNRLKSEKKGYM